MSPKKRIQELAGAYLLASAIHAAAELRIADILWEKQKKSIDAIANELEVDSRSLFRLLRFLLSYKIFTQHEDGKISLNSEASYLAEKHPESIRHALLVNVGRRWNALGAISKSIRFGKPSFDLLYQQSYYEYLEKNKKSQDRFNAHMTSYTQEEDKKISPLLPISHAKFVADIGGGEGQFLSKVLEVFPHVHGTLFDLKQTLAKITIQSRLTLHPGNFFTSIPKGQDIYMLKRVLHNWNDEDCLKILKNIRAVMKKESKILIIEGIVPTDNSQHASKDADFLLMTFFSGAERTKSEFAKLLEKSELHLQKILPTNTFLSIIEAIPNESFANR